MLARDSHTVSTLQRPIFFSPAGCCCCSQVTLLPLTGWSIVWLLSVEANTPLPPKKITITNYFVSCARDRILLNLLCNLFFFRCGVISDVGAMQHKVLNKMDLSCLSVYFGPVVTVFSSKVFTAFYINHNPQLRLLPNS